MFVLDLFVSEILTFRIFDLENYLGQGHRAQHSQ